VVIAAFKALAKQLLIISVIIAFAATVVLLIDGKAAALALLTTAVVGMKGPWVWTTGYGLASFVTDRGRSLPATINGFLEPNDVSATLTARIERSTIHRCALRYTVPITVLGFFLTCVYGIPNQGIAYVFILAGVCAIYYVAAFLLCHFVEFILAFQGMFDAIDGVEFRTIYSPLHLENLASYLSITTGIGLVAIYAGFRGTLTAGFQFKNEVWRAFLSTPLILFLPGTLFYNYYPRYVLRKIVQHRVFRAMERLSNAHNDLDAKKLLFEMKESAYLNAQILPFVDYKSLPSYLIAALFVINLAYSNDPAVQAFVKYIVGFGSPR
jgi:hypothetical protein